MTSGCRISRRRLFILLALLFACAAAAWSQSSWLAQIPNGVVKWYLSRHHDQRALNCLAWSRWLSDRNGETEFLRGRTMRRLGFLLDAQEHLQRARALGWNEDDVQRERWLCLAQAGQMRDAEPQLPRLLADPRQDGPEICEAYVIGYLKMRQFPPAEVLLDAWSRDHPVDPQPYYWRALLQRELSQTAAAERSLRWALDLQPDHYRAAYMLAELLYQDKQQIVEALRWYRLAAEDSEQRVLVTVGIARCLRVQGNLREAERELVAAVAQSGNDKELVLELASLLIELGRGQAAIDHLEPLLAGDKKDKGLQFAYGMALRAIGRSADAEPHLAYATEAAKELQRVIHLSQRVNQERNSAAIRYEIGSVMLKYGHIKDGLIWLESALQIDPLHRPAHRLLAEHYQQRAAERKEFRQMADHHKQLAESAQ